MTTSSTTIKLLIAEHLFIVNVNDVAKTTQEQKFYDTLLSPFIAHHTLHQNPSATIKINIHFIAGHTKRRYNISRLYARLDSHFTHVFQSQSREVQINMQSFLAEIDRMHPNCMKSILADPTALLIMQPSLIMRFNRRSYTFDVYYKIHTKRTNQFMPVIKLLRILRDCVHFLLNIKGQGFLLHASGVVVNGETHLFMGKSKQGKSTIARMLSPCKCLADDRIPVIVKRNTLIAYAAPWWSLNNIKLIAQYGPKTPCNAPVRALYFIHQSDTTRMVPVSYGKTIEFLFRGDASGQNIFAYAQKQDIKNTYERILVLAAIVPAFELFVKKERQFRKKFIALTKKI